MFNIELTTCTYNRKWTVFQKQELQKGAHVVIRGYIY